MSAPNDTQKSHWLSEVTPVRVFTWFMGAVSLINLLSNLNIVKIRSDILLWIETYRRVVESVGEFLFGWLDFWILGISTSEIHGLILLYLIAATTARSLKYQGPWTASYRERQWITFKPGFLLDNPEAIKSGLLYALVPLASVLILSDPMGMILLLAFAAGLLWHHLGVESPDELLERADRDPEDEEVQMDLHFSWELRRGYFVSRRQLRVNLLTTLILAWAILVFDYLYRQAT